MGDHRAVQPAVQPETEQPVVNAASSEVSVNAVSAVEQTSQMQQAPVQEHPAIQSPASQQAVKLDAQVEMASADETALQRLRTMPRLQLPPPRLLLPWQSPHSSR